MERVVTSIDVTVYHSTISHKSLAAVRHVCTCTCPCAWSIMGQNNNIAV
jgi:hypothetical protein